MINNSWKKVNAIILLLVYHLIYTRAEHEACMYEAAPKMIACPSGNLLLTRLLFWWWLVFIQIDILTSKNMCRANSITNIELNRRSILFLLQILWYFSFSFHYFVCCFFLFFFDWYIKFVSFWLLLAFFMLIGRHEAWLSFHVKWKFWKINNAKLR